MKKLVGLFCLLALSVSVIAGTDETKDPSKKPIKDSTKQPDNLEALGFKNLFKADTYNPSQPYTTQINPTAIDYVKDYMSRQGKSLESMKLWAQPYFRMMDAILVSYGIPKELKYLAVIESQLQPWAYSWAGAVGPWQFMPETGRRMGLVINSAIDERANYIRSTQAAAKYLRELYGQLGDWLLVIAAYNGGPGRVFSAMKKSGSKDFWKLQNYLPQESRNHVKKFIGTHYIMEGSGGQTTTTTDEWAQLQSKTLDQTNLLQSQLDEETLKNTFTYNIEGKYNSVVIANELVIDIAEFNRLNPNFDRLVSLEGGYDLRLPQAKMEVFQANQFILLRQSLMTTLNAAGTIGAGYPEAKAKPVQTSTTVKKKK
jgi:membrane-bound lytic murein transglycosylase D